HLEADETTLIDRITTRRQLGNDPSEAGIGVLKSQLATQEPLAASELPDVLLIQETAAPGLDSLVRRLREKCSSSPGQQMLT
ncbi:MAG: hypothetical protein PVH38_10395, partial [Gammaproteobacteria bacterium]